MRLLRYASDLPASLHANAPEPGKFERRPAQVEAEHCAQEIDLKPFDPADGDAEVTGQRNKDAAARGCQSEPTALVRKSLPIAVGGSTALSSGTALRTAWTKVFEFGPGHAL